MLGKLNGILQKYMPLFAPLGLLIGGILGERITSYTFLVTWLFAFMTFSGSLNSNFTHIRKSFSRPLPIIMTVVILHAVMPIFVWLIGHFLFPDEPYIIIGLVLAFVIPTGITSFIWISMYKGHIGLTLSVILISSMLSPFIVPFSMTLFADSKVKIDFWDMIMGLLMMIVIPSILGMVLNNMTHGAIKNVLADKLAPFAKLSLIFIIIINGAKVVPYLKNLDSSIFKIAIVVVLLLGGTGYLLGFIISTVFKWDKEVRVSLIFNCGMRNLGAGTVLALTYFPSPVLLPIVIAMLFEQLLASLGGVMIKRFGSNSNTKTNKKIHSQINP
ncbi:bile acid:sodium symporter family protein [Priestia endophytica]|uniref:bile acid:sodium symporter family protein n=1 Tax=Priestia endophytica TaxID=135735 RepID=UPI000DCA92D6|nr:bile acid:sodium symporter family protein [Priestia endophytica]RAS85711.1 hypothetical protein A4U60_09195 [Priestia endophytica]